ncbi:MAG: hypothetical protein RMI39_07190, partial [Thermoanaerobaculum sp.]|nr:hypothetical protein [Thermoanaerobaculum sp.]
MSEHLYPGIHHQRLQGLATGANVYQPQPARIMKVTELTPEVRLFDLRFVDPQLAQRFDFRPGQFVELSILGV